MQGESIILNLSSNWNYIIICMFGLRWIHFFTFFNDSLSISKLISIRSCHGQSLSWQWFTPFFFAGSVFESVNDFDCNNNSVLSWLADQCLNQWIISQLKSTLFLFSESVLDLVNQDHWGMIHWLVHWFAK